MDVQSHTTIQILQPNILCDSVILPINTSKTKHWHFGKKGTLPKIIPACVLVLDILSNYGGRQLEDICVPILKL